MFVHPIGTAQDASGKIEARLVAFFFCVCVFCDASLYLMPAQLKESKTAEYAEDILWDTIEEPQKEAVGAIVQDVLGSAVPDAMSLFISFLEVV